MRIFLLIAAVLFSQSAHAAEVGSVNGVAAASVGSFNGVPAASIGKIMGVDFPAGGVLLEGCETFTDDLPDSLPWALYYFDETVSQVSSNVTQGSFACRIEKTMPDEFNAAGISTDGYDPEELTLLTIDVTVVDIPASGQVFFMAQPYPGSFDSVVDQTVAGVESSTTLEVDIDGLLPDPLPNWMIEGTAATFSDEFGIETVSSTIDLSGYETLAFTVTEATEDDDSSNFGPRFEITDGVDTFTQVFFGASAGTEVNLSLASAIASDVDTSAVRIRVYYRSFNEAVSGDFSIANLRGLPDEEDPGTYDVLDDFNTTPYASDLTWQDYELGTGIVDDVSSGTPLEHFLTLSIFGQGDTGDFVFDIDNVRGE